MCYLISLGNTLARYPLLGVLVDALQAGKKEKVSSRLSHPRTHPFETARDGGGGTTGMTAAFGEGSQMKTQAMIQEVF